MHTRFTQLVKYKNNEMQKCERELIRLNGELMDAKEKLKMAYDILHQLQIPQEGEIQTFLQSRTTLAIQRDIIKKNADDIEKINYHVKQAKESLKSSMIEYEKFKYLETQQIKKIVKKRMMQESKELDDAALQTFIGRQQ
jgi:flagellar biosynthesis chaperone FliJ